MPHDSDPRLLALLGLRLKGFGGSEPIAEVLGVAVDEVEVQLEALIDAELVMYREGAQMSGFALTPAGREEGQLMLRRELDSAGVVEIVDGAYRRFLDLNGDMLRLCTDWQVKPDETLNDHADDDYDQEVIGRLVALNDHLRSIMVDLRGALSRFEAYPPRFRDALEKLLAGELDYFTKPIIPSYHTVWFELHEDLLATLGIDRASEASA
jgi:hypothetical protein